MAELERVGEVIEASSTDFVAQCYELFELPPLGSLVKTRGEVELYGVVYNATTTSIEPGRRPIARGKDEATEEAIYRENPQLAKLFRSEFGALVVGHKENDRIFHFLPPKPARIHSFVYLCQVDEVREFSRSFDFLNTLVNAHLAVPLEEITSACLRQMSRAHEDPRQFLVAAGKELAVLLSSDFNRVKAILERIKSD